MGLVKHYYTLIQLGGDERNKKTLRAEAARAIEILKRAHAEWAAMRVKRLPDGRQCPNGKCKQPMAQTEDGAWSCAACGSMIRKVRLE